MSRINQAPGRRNPPACKLFIACVPAPGCLNGCKAGAAKAGNVKTGKAHSLQFLYLLRRHAAACLFHNDRNIRTILQTGQIIPNQGKLFVSLRHNQFLGHIQMDLQGVCPNHIHGSSCLFRRSKSADIGKEDAIGILLTNHRKGICMLPFSDRTVLGPYRQGNTGTPCHRSQFPVDFLYTVRTAGNGINHHRNRQFKVADPGAYIHPVRLHRRQAVVQKTDILQTCLALSVS